MSNLREVSQVSEEVAPAVHMPIVVGNEMFVLTQQDVRRVVDTRYLCFNRFDGSMPATQLQSLNFHAQQNVTAMPQIGNTFTFSVATSTSELNDEDKCSRYCQTDPQTRSQACNMEPSVDSLSDDSLSDDSSHSSDDLNIGEETMHPKSSSESSQDQTSLVPVPPSCVPNEEFQKTMANSIVV